MKIIKKISIFLVILISICLTACKKEMSFVYDDKDYLVGDAELENIKNIKIEWAGTSANISGWDGDKIHIFEEIDEDVKEDYQLHYKVDGDTLYIEPSESKLIPNFGFQTKALHVDVPKSWQLDSIELKLLSTKGVLKDVNCKDINISSVTGEISFNNITSDNALISTNGANVNVVGGNNNNLEIDTRSGVVSINNAKNNILVKSTNGDINLVYAEDRNFSVELADVNGEVTNEYDSLIRGEDIKIKIEGGSGKIAIKKK